MAVVVVGALAITGAVFLFTGRGGGRSDRAAVDAYIRDLNRGDVNSLNDDIYPALPGLAQTIINDSHRPWSVTNISIVHEFEPDYGVAQLWGSAAGSNLQIRLPLIRHDGTWYVAESTMPPPTADSSASTARP